MLQLCKTNILTIKCQHCPHLLILIDSGSYKKLNYKAKDLAVKQELRVAEKRVPRWTCPTEPHKNSRFFANFDKSLFLLTTMPTDTERTPKPGECHNKLLHLPSMKQLHKEINN